MLQIPSRSGTGGAATTKAVILVSAFLSGDLLPFLVANPLKHRLVDHPVALVSGRCR